MRKQARRTAPATHVVARSPPARRGGGDVERRERAAGRGDGRPTPPSPRRPAPRRSRSSSASAWSAARPMRVSRSASSGGAEARGVRHRLAPREAQRGEIELVGVRRRHLDVVADHVVVPDLQRRHAGRRPVLGLQRRRSSCGCRRAGCAARRARRGSPARMKPPSRASSGGSSASARGQSGSISARWSRQRHDDLGERRRRRRQRLGLGAAAAPASASRRIEPVAQGRPGRAGRRGRPAGRCRARSMSGVRFSASRTRSRTRRPLDEEAAPGRAARSIAGALGQRRRDAARPAGARRGRSACGRWWPAGCPRGRPSSPRTSSRLRRVAGSISIVPSARSRRGGASAGSLPAWVSST